MSWLRNWFASRSVAELSLSDASVRGSEIQIQEHLEHQKETHPSLLVCLGHSGPTQVPHRFQLMRLDLAMARRMSMTGLFIAQAAAFHPAAPVVYISHMTYPRKEGEVVGSVSAVNFDPATGEVLMVTQQFLSVSSSLSSLTMMPDGKHLLVALAKGAYNLLPVSAVGTLGEVISNYQEQEIEVDWEVGIGPTSLLSHPFLSLAYCSNMRGNRIDVVRTNASRFTVETDMVLEPGYSPSGLALHERSGRLFVVSIVTERIAAIKVDRMSGRSVGTFAYTRAESPSGRLIVHPTNNLLYVVHAPRKAPSLSLLELTASISIWDIGLSSLIPNQLKIIPLKATRVFPNAADRRAIIPRNNSWSFLISHRRGPIL